MDTKSWKVYGSVMILGTTDTYMQRSACQWWSVLHGHFAFMSPFICTRTASRNSWSHNVRNRFLFRSHDSKDYAYIVYITSNPNKQRTVYKVSYRINSYGHIDAMDTYFMCCGWLRVNY